MEVVTKSASETQKLGEKLGGDLRSGPASLRQRRTGGATRGQATILALEGALGSGKTTLVQGLAKGLGIKKRIISPTFIIVRSYDALGKVFYHVDLYRLEGNLKNEIENLGLTEIWEDPKNIVVIEWAEKIKEHLPERAKWVRFEHLGEDRRRIVIDE